MTPEEYLDADEEYLDAEDKDTLGWMPMSQRLINCLGNEGYRESTRVIDVLEGTPFEQMKKIRNLGKKTIKEFTDIAEKVVGVDAIQRWLNGQPPRE